MINLEDYLTIVAAYIKRDGYVKSAYEDPTWKKALAVYEGSAKPDISTTRDDERLAKETIMYFLDRGSGTSDYVNKVRNILVDVIKLGQPLEKKQLPFIASAVQSYLKNQAYKKKKEEAEDAHKKEVIRSHYVGEIGDTITVQVEEMSYKVIDTRFGETIMYKFVDEHGNIFIWFTGKDIPDNISEITGTVKAHNEFQDVKQTVLTRCKYR